MKKINIIIFFGAVLLLSFEAKTEIKNQEVLMAYFQGCVEDDNPILSLGDSFEFCGCSANLISSDMDMEELLRLSFDALQEEDYENQNKKILANEKVKEILIKCAAKVLE